MTHQPLTKAERAHLTLLHAAARDPASTARERATAQAQLADQLVWTGRTDLMKGDLPRLLADLDAAEAERDALKAKLAALLQAATDLREVAFDGPSEQKGAGVHGGREGVFDWKQRIDCESAAAIAAARGGAQ